MLFFLRHFAHLFAVDSLVIRVIGASWLQRTELHVRIGTRIAQVRLVSVLLVRGKSRCVDSAGRLVLASRNRGALVNCLVGAIETACHIHYLRKVALSIAFWFFITLVGCLMSRWLLLPI